MNEEQREQLNALAENVIGAAFEVGNVLGAGYLEKVYENALLHELTLRGVKAQNQGALRVMYKGVCVGDYFPDILVDNRLIVELKCCDALRPEHFAQCINYLRASGLALALLLNFQKPRVEVKRVVLNF